MGAESGGSFWEKDGRATEGKNWGKLGFSFWKWIVVSQEGGDHFFSPLNSTIFCAQPSKGGQFYEKKHR